tara:strand:+ start:6829 stop:8016 length:1188 start_codon:yes stop_codon:yes gene_type:complete
MAIPLITNVGFTEVSSSGVLNDKASTGANKLPIQLFKLSGAISGNLQMNNDSAHKKIILDTNGNNITNSSGSPLTNNSSVALELKGSGNVQSTLKTFTSSQSSTGNSGTTTISEADNSTVVVQTDTHTFDTALVSDSRGSGASSGSGGGVSFGDGNTTVTKPNTGSNSAMLVNETYYTTGFTTLFGGVGLDNIDRSDFGMSFTHAFMEDGTPISGRISGPSTSGGTGGTSTFDGGTSKRPSTNTTHSHAGGTYRFMKWDDALVGVNTGNIGSFDIEMFIDSATGKAVVAIIGGRGAFNQIKNVSVTGPTAGRRFIFTNNLAISCTLSGSDPFSATVSAGATNTVNRDSTDGSFSLTGTISGSDGSSRPFALKDINDGSGSVNEDAYTGTKSVSAF